LRRKGGNQKAIKGRDHAQFWSIPTGKTRCGFKGIAVSVREALNADQRKKSVARVEKGPLLKKSYCAKGERKNI